jgi:hypothetical protein
MSRPRRATARGEWGLAQLAVIEHAVAVDVFHERDG